MLAADAVQGFGVAGLEGYAGFAVGVRDGREDFEAFVAGVFYREGGVGGGCVAGVAVGVVFLFGSVGC